MQNDWQQIDFSFISSTFTFDYDYGDLDGGYHPNSLVPHETIDQMAALLQRRAGISEWSDWLREVVTHQRRIQLQSHSHAAQILTRAHPETSSSDARPLHQLVLKWSLFLSNILTELTLVQGEFIFLLVQVCKAKRLVA